MYNSSQKLVVDSTIKEGFVMGAEYIGPIFINGILWLLTCWIPYLNIGTTIGLTTGIVAKVSRGEMIPVTEIFDPKYRRHMGEVTLLAGLIGMGITAGLALLVIPGFVFAISWSLAFLFKVDKEKNIAESIALSAGCTYGYKFKMVCIYLVVSLLFFVAYAILGGIAFLLITMDLKVIAAIFILFFLIIAFFQAFVLVGLNASIYKQLTADI